MTNFRRSAQDPEVVALAALGFLAGEPERLVRFLDLSGMTPQDLRQRAGDPVLLAAVLDHLLADETLLFLFADSEAMHPAEIAAARHKLPGGGTS